MKKIVAVCDEVVFCSQLRADSDIHDSTAQLWAVGWYVCFQAVGTVCLVFAL